MSPEVGRGAQLVKDIRKAMDQLSSVAVNSEDLPEGLDDNSYGREIITWFDFMGKELDAITSELKLERNSYYRALFDLSTDKRTRLRLVEQLNALPIIVRYMENSEHDDEAATLVAAVANMVYEDTTKVLIMKECRIPPLFCRLLKSEYVAIATHAARGIFSLTTVYEFKKCFATEDGILPTLIACLSKDSKSLVMNAAGAIANIAIHPESKVLIVSLHALTPLLDLGTQEDDENVLHQVSRCLFSLAADKHNRPIMVERGLLPVISRLLNYRLQPDILANAIGCFGNLAMSETVAQENSTDIVLRILPLLITSTHSALDRQATRVLFSFSCHPKIKEVLARREYLEMLVRKLDSKEEAIVRDVLCIISSVVSGSLELKEEICELNGFSKILLLFERHKSDIILHITRAIYAIVNCNSAKDMLCMHMPLLTKLAQLARSGTSGVNAGTSKHALGALANIACEPKYFPQLVQASALLCGVHSLITNRKLEARKQAGRLLYNITRRQGHALSYLVRYGGPDGEDKRVVQDYRTLFASNFALFPASVAHTFAPEGEGTLIGKKGMATLYISVTGYHQQSPDLYVALVYKPLIASRCPTMLSRLGSGSDSSSLTSPSASSTVWTALFELIYTGTLSAETSALVLEEAEESDLSSSMDLVALCREFNIDFFDPMHSPHSDDANAHKSYPQPLHSTNSNVTIAVPTTDDFLLFGPPSVAPMILSELHEHSLTMFAEDSSYEDNVISNGRRSWDESVLSMIGADDADIIIRATLKPNERLRPRPMTRAAKGVIAPFSAFVQDMINEWISYDINVATVTLAQPRRKRIRPTDPHEVHIRVHRAVLSVRSAYFKSLFGGRFRDEGDSVQFQGSVDTLVVLLRYLYNGMDTHLRKALKNDLDLCMRCLKTAHEYSVEGLQFQCEGYLLWSLNELSTPQSVKVKRALELSELTGIINVPFLKMACAQIAFTVKLRDGQSEEATQILENTGFTNLLVLQ